MPSAAENPHGHATAGRVPWRTTQARVGVAVLIGLLAAAYQWRVSTLMPHFWTDFDPIRFAARLVLHGENPYTEIGPHAKYFWNFPLAYPMPAVVIAMPFLVVPIVWARCLFVGLTSGGLAYAVTSRAWWPLLVFASASWVDAVGLAQWSPAMYLASLVPAFGFVLAAKPNIGVAVLAGA